MRLLVRGAPVTDADRAREDIQLQSASNRLEVVVRVYTAEQERMDDDLDIASLVIMPSRQEGSVSSASKRSRGAFRSW